MYRENCRKELIFSNPLHPFIMALLSAIPVPDLKIKRERVELSGEVPSFINIPSGCRFYPHCPCKEDICPMEEPQLIDLKNRYVACHRVQ